MPRKRSTTHIATNDNQSLLREKKKWQIALRRYVLEKHKSISYAPYFGLDNNKFREWIELQFEEGLTWDNFSTKWQFEHIVPVAYFNFTSENDLKLCWNFTNIHVDRIEPEPSIVFKLDTLGAKAYFQDLFQKTGYPICGAMVDKIQSIEASQLATTPDVESFLNQYKDYLEAVRTLSPEDFERLNTGTELKSLLYEKDFLKKFAP